MKDFLYSPDPDPDHAAKPRKKLDPDIGPLEKPDPKYLKVLIEKRSDLSFALNKSTAENGISFTIQNSKI